MLIVNTGHIYYLSKCQTSAQIVMWYWHCVKVCCAYPVALQHATMHLLKYAHHCLKSMAKATGGFSTFLHKG